MVKNYMEIVVENVLDEVLKTSDLECKCEECKDDIKAITLNNLKPTYVATDKGALYTRLNEFNVQFKTDVVQEIMNSIEKIKENPRH